MNVTIVCIGKLKEKYWREAIAEYSKRLGSYCTLRICELKESRLAANPSPADEEAVKEAAALKRGTDNRTFIPKEPVSVEE